MFNTRMAVQSIRSKIHPALHIVGGKPLDVGRKIKVFNPATGTIVGVAPASFPKAKIKDLEHFALDAHQCWHHEVREQEKEAVFRHIIKKFEAHRGMLARTMVLEGGKLWRWADAEVQEAIDTLWHYHGEISRYHASEGLSRCQLPDKNAFAIRVPYGVILAITPWNFPLAVPMWKVCGALAGGNAVIVKCAEQTPFTMQYALRLMSDAVSEIIFDGRAKKLRGLVQLVQGPGETSGKLLLEELSYDKVAFTGSAETGKIIASVAGARLKPCHLELGGHANIVVLDDFDTDRAVAETLMANLGDSGQRCVSTRCVFVQKSKYRQFLKKYLAAARIRVIGDPMDMKTELGPLISKEHLERVHGQVQKTARELKRGPEIGGQPLNDRGGYYYPPTVFTNVPYGTTAMDEEIFGPVLVVNPLSGKNREEAFWNAVRLVNQSFYGLSNALLTNDRRLASRAPWHFRTGIFYIGRGTTGAELNKYFGGIKSSGWGREGKGLEDWTQIVQVYDDYHEKMRMAQTGADEHVQARIAQSRSPLEQ